jgi:hypothetical protein
MTREICQSILDEIIDEIEYYYDDTDYDYIDYIYYKHEEYADF